MRKWEQFLKVSGWDSEYSSVHNFLLHYKRRLGSEQTKDQVCDALMSLSRFAKMSPDDLVKTDAKEASQLLQSYVDSLADKGYSIRTVNVVLAYLKTFFRVNGFKGARELDVERYHQPSRYRKRAEYIPASDEIYRMAFSAGSARNKAMIFALYTSGLRNSTLRSLLYRDLRDELGRLDIVKVPVYAEMKLVDPGGCKGNIPYYSFISKEAVEALQEYLQQRRKLYGSIEDDEPLFASTSTNVPLQVRRRTHVKKRSLDEIVKKAARKAGITKWKDVYPHCLRKAFESALRNGGLDPKDQEFLMGHILPGSQDTYYDHSKVEQLRAKYAGVKFFKSTSMDKLEMIKAFAQTLGIDNVEVKIQKLRESQEEVDEMNALGKIIRQELGINPIKTDTTKHKKQNQTTNCQKSNSSTSETKIVTESQLLPHLNNGWSLVRELKSGKLVIRRNLEYA